MRRDGTGADLMIDQARREPAGRTLFLFTPEWGWTTRLLLYTADGEIRTA